MVVSGLILFISLTDELVSGAVDAMIVAICECKAIWSDCINFRINDGVDDFKCPPCFMKESKSVPYVCF